MMLDGTPLGRLYASRRLGALAREDAVLVQQRQLSTLIKRAADTRFGREHGFGGIQTVDEFQRRVPLRKYEAMWNEYWKPSFPTLVDCSWPGKLPYFALSSGTTSGTTKYIPCSREMIRANGRAALDILVHHLANSPESRVLGGASFVLGGSTDLSRLAGGVQAGDLSGIAAASAPSWARGRIFPPRELALIADWENKVDVLSERILGLDVRTIAGTPSWLLVFFDHLFARRQELPGRLGAFFPNLELVIHGGVNFLPYRPRFDALLEGTRAETREVYAASEGFIAAADRGPGEGMRLLADNGLFYEFVPVNELDAPKPTRHWLATAEAGVDYAIVLSSCAGLWSYVVGDTVKFVELKPPRILITGRTSYTLSSFGEHLTGTEIEGAVSTAAAGIGEEVADFSVGSIFPDETRSRGNHLFVVEFRGSPPDAANIGRFLQTLDGTLSRLNDDYRAHRSPGVGLNPPETIVAPPGMFQAWMKSRGQLGGQHKVPRIIANAELFESLRRFAAAYRESEH
jgi:hypothetical protein